MCRLGDCQRVETTGTEEGLVLQGNRLKSVSVGRSFVLRRRSSLLFYVTATGPYHYPRGLRHNFRVRTLELPESRKRFDGNGEEGGVSEGGGGQVESMWHGELL